MRNNLLGFFFEKRRKIDCSIYNMNRKVRIEIEDIERIGLVDFNNCWNGDKVEGGIDYDGIVF